MERSPLSQRFAFQRVLLVDDPEERHDAKHEVVSVDFDKVVSGDGCRVDVVLAERADERAAEPCLDTAERVSAPVHQSRQKVRRHDAQHGVEQHGF